MPMKLVRSGGTNGTLDTSDTNYATYGFGNYFMLQIKPELDEIIESGGIIALCVAAKPNKHHYDRPLTDIGFTMSDFTILGRDDEAQWEQYDAVLMLGGETKELHTWLTRTNFNLDSLKNCRILGGDSAGAYVLSGKILIDYTADGSTFEITDGFLPKLNQLIAAHINNMYYHQPELTKVLSQWCKENNVEYIELEEDEIQVIEI